MAESLAMDQLAIRKRHREFLRLFAESGFDERKKAECAYKAGYSMKYAQDRANQILNNPKINDLLQQIMAERGLELEMVVDEHKRILTSGMHPFRPKQPDNIARLKAIDMAYKGYDVMPSTKVDVHKTVDAKYNMTIEDVRKMEEVTGEKIIDAETIEEDDIEPL